MISKPKKPFKKLSIILTIVIIAVFLFRVFAVRADSSLIKTMLMWYAQLTQKYDRNQDQKINLIDISQIPANGTNSGGVVVVSDFTRYPGLSELMNPLVQQWVSEGKSIKFINIQDAQSFTGRDMAEKLRQLLFEQYQNQPFRYLFLVDVFKPDLLLGGTHVVPARIFVDNHFIGERFTIWSDYYFSDLHGNFDTNQNNEYELYDDYLPGSGLQQVLVGRIMFDEANLNQQVTRYVQADISFRKNPVITDAMIVKHSTVPFRQNSSIHWPTGDLNEETETILAAFQYRNLNYTSLTAPDKAQVFTALSQNDLVYFSGHGSIYSQQINEPDGIWVDLPELQNLENVQKPKFIIFLGCETGSLYSDSTMADCPDKSLCVAQQTIAQSLLLNQAVTSIPAVAAVASTITHSQSPVDFADLYQSAVWNQSLAQSVNENNRIRYADLVNPGQTAPAYFGDPTLPFPTTNQDDSIAPTISFNTTRDVFAAVDHESGTAWVELSWDNEPFLPIDDYFPHEPHLLPTNKVFYENHTLKIRVWDRAGHLVEQTQTYP